MNYQERFRKFYNSKEWVKLRALKFADANGLCENCLKKNKIVQGIDVHHIIPIEQDWDKRLDYDNLRLLCKECHNEVHNRESVLIKFMKEWDNL